MQCVNCGGAMNGDGYTSVLVCENFDEERDDNLSFAAPDEGPFYCHMDEVADPDFFITVTHGISGYFAVLLGTDAEAKKEFGESFREPYNTGMGRYRTHEEAEFEAMEWAAAEEIPYL